jgi:osmoprotectant transport system permease protein
LTILTDPKEAMPHYDAILLVSPARARDEHFLSVLRPLTNAIRVEDMRTANYSVDRDRAKATPDQAAAWLDRRTRH